MKRIGKRWVPKNRAVVGVLAAWVFSVSFEFSHAQGTIVHITFDGPPPIPGRGYLFLDYQESGIYFVGLTNSAGYGGFNRINRYVFYPYPYNGTPYITANAFGPIEVRSLNQLPFGLISVDLAEDMAIDPRPSTVRFIGFRSDGGVVTNTFTTDGLIWVEGVPDFQTFYFGPEFHDGLTRVWIQWASWASFCMDNLYVYVIPEPTAWALLGLGGGLFLCSLRLRANRSRVLPPALRPPAGS